MEVESKYQSVASQVKSLGSIVPKQLAACTSKALSKLSNALDGDVCGYVSKRLRMSAGELNDALLAEQVDSVALAMYNIEKRAQSLIIGDQTGVGKGRQAAAMIRYGLLNGYLPIFFTDRYTLFSDMYRDCKALGIKDARPLVVNSGVAVVDFDNVVEVEADGKDGQDEIWSPVKDNDDDAAYEAELMDVYQKQYEVVYKAPKKSVLQKIFESGDIPSDSYDYLMITYSQLKDAKRDMTRLDFLMTLCKKHRVLFIFDEAHRSSSVSAGKVSVITQCINSILTEAPETQCLFLSATFAKRPESLVTFMRRTALSALATESTLAVALHLGGVPMQEYVSSSLAAEGQMIRREHSPNGIPAPVYNYLEDEQVVHGVLFDKVMYFFREIVKLSAMVKDLVCQAQVLGKLLDFKCYPTRAQLFYVNKVLLLSLKAQSVAQIAVDEVKKGRSVVIGLSDTLECVLQDVEVMDDGSVRGDMSTVLRRLADKTICNSDVQTDGKLTVFEMLKECGEEIEELTPYIVEVKDFYMNIKNNVNDCVFHLPMSPIDVIRQLVTRERFEAPDGVSRNIRFEECTGRAHQLEYLSPEGDDDFVNAHVVSRVRRHSNHIFNDFQNNKLDVILINACGAIGASAHAISTAEVPESQVRQRKMLIVQNDLDINIDFQKRGRINRTGQRLDLPPLYEYIITTIPSERRLNMMLRAKLRSLSANTAGWQDQEKEQADFIDIDNKYGNEVAADYIHEHEELAWLLGLKGAVTASKLLARISMLSVKAQQDIVDELMSAYSNLESELRRVNQWDLEREFRDFEAEFVREELFTTAMVETRLGGCSFLTTYKCKHKTFPYTYESLNECCQTAKDLYDKNIDLRSQIHDYYCRRNKSVRAQFAERHKLLEDNARRILLSFIDDESAVAGWLQRAAMPSASWSDAYFEDVNALQMAKQIMRKLVSFSNEHNNLLEREKNEIKKYAAERKRLVEVLAKAEIGKGYDNISAQLANEECPYRVVAVLRDIRFGKEERNRFMPSQVEFVFALSAVFKEIRVNLVHNKKWSNYERLLEILNSKQWNPSADDWDSECARYNNKIVERKIITGNILGAYVHPAIAQLKPRFITFSLKGDEESGVKVQNGLLLPMDESKIRSAINTVSIPLHEGVRYATNTNTCYTIAGLGVDFTFLPLRMSDTCVKFVIGVADKHSSDFEQDIRFDAIRPLFVGSPIKSIYEKEQPGKVKRKTLMHYQTEQLTFDSEQLQQIVQTLSLLNAVIIIPRDQMSYADVEGFSSRSERNDDEPWEFLDWKNETEVATPPVKKSILLRISAPIVQKAQKGQPVSKHSEIYTLAEKAMALNGQPLNVRTTTDNLRRVYQAWKIFYNTRSQIWCQGYCTMSEVRDLCLELLVVAENKSKAHAVCFSPDTQKVLQTILDSEYLEPGDLFLARFDDELLFQSPDKAQAQAFLDSMPCSPRLDDIRKCVQDYVDGKTDVINSPDKW